MAEQPEGYANPDDQIEQLAEQFVHCDINKRHGIPFWRFVELQQNGTWLDCLID